jgi:hypothetical protein
VVEVHDGHFPIEAEDVDWLPVVGQKGWVLISKDKAIRRNPLERAALLNANVRSFFLTGGNLTGPEMAAIPFIATVTRTEVKIIAPGSSPAP